MNTLEAAEDASEKLHKKYMERRYVEVFQVGVMSWRAVVGAAMSVCGCGGRG